jgi:hypothetical protein
VVWLLQTYTPAQPLFQLKSINFEEKLKILYEDVVFEAAQSSPTTAEVLPTHKPSVDVSQVFADIVSWQLPMILLCTA